MSGWEEDLYFKKRIDYAINRQRFAFDAADLLFSTYSIDSGTQFLLRYMLAGIDQPRSVLDLGCGYGVIGIVLARFYPEAHVVMVDKDLLAIRYTRHNVGINAVHNTEIFPSIGTSDIHGKMFDLIVSNVPGHIGDLAIEQDFLLKPLDLLNTGGAYWFVVVTPLVELVERVALQHNLSLQEIAKRAQHRVYRIDKVKSKR
jgi:16S rRNA (guanine1207-N2)-methyltransferase